MEGLSANSSGRLTLQIAGNPLRCDCDVSYPQAPDGLDWRFVNPFFIIISDFVSKRYRKPQVLARPVFGHAIAVSRPQAGFEMNQNFLFDPLGIRGTSAWWSFDPSHEKILIKGFLTPLSGSPIIKTT